MIILEKDKENFIKVVFIVAIILLIAFTIYFSL